jgi:hypothetical protein
MFFGVLWKAIRESCFSIIINKALSNYFIIKKLNFMTKLKTEFDINENIMEALKEMQDNDEISIRSYSGRNMYGKSCLGIITENYLLFLMQFGALLQENNENVNDRNFKPLIDNMGKKYVIYFPNILSINEIN